MAEIKFEDKIAEEIAKELINRGINFIEIGIFGSRATGKAKPTSDWDFYAWVDRDIYEKERGKLDREIGMKVSPLNPASIECTFGKDKSRCVDFKLTPKRPLTGKPIISKDIKFIRDKRHSAQDRFMMEVDTDKLDKLWKLDEEYYLPKGKEKINLDEPITAPIIDFTTTGISFLDGRHRFAALRDMGIKRVVIMVKPEDVKKAIELLDGKFYTEEDFIRYHKTGYIPPEYYGLFILAGVIGLMYMIKRWQKS